LNSGTANGGLVSPWPKFLEVKQIDGKVNAGKNQWSWQNQASILGCSIEAQEFIDGLTSIWMCNPNPTGECVRMDVM
jgi:hypothetical protein